MKLTDNQLANIFCNAHQGATEQFGLAWFIANRQAVSGLRSVGIDPEDTLVKAVSSVVLRYALRQILEDKE